MSDDLVATLRAIVERFDALSIAYMIVGSVAALAHGRARSTQDFDVVIEVDRASLLALVRSLPPERFYVSEDAAIEALERRSPFNVIDLATGWKIDLIPLKPRAFSKREFARRRPLPTFDLTVDVASVEDVILAKLEWSKREGGSSRQLEDVRELVRIAGDRLDRAYVDRGAAELGGEDAWTDVTRSSRVPAVPVPCGARARRLEARLKLALRRCPVGVGELLRGLR